MYKAVIITSASRDADKIKTYISASGLSLEISGCFDSGTPALAYIEKNHVDIVISDILLPGPSGLDIARRTIKYNPDCTFILISKPQDFSYDSVKDAVEIGIASYLLKPVEPEILINSIYRVIEKIETAKKQAMHDIRQGPGISDKKTPEQIAGQLYEYILSNYEKPLTMNSLSNRFYLSESYINKLLVKYRKKTFKKILNETRIEKAKRLMSKSPDMPIQEVAVAVGFNDAHYFSRTYKAYTGISPSHDKIYLMISANNPSIY